MSPAGAALQLPERGPFRVEGEKEELSSRRKKVAGGPRRPRPGVGAQRAEDPPPRSQQFDLFRALDEEGLPALLQILGIAEGKATSISETLRDAMNAE